MKKIPLSFAWLYLLIGAYAVMIACLPFCPKVQRVMMEKFHLRSPSFVRWGALQFAPSMYNFANQVWLTKSAVNPQELLSPQNNPHITDHLWTNHYPFWPITFFRRDIFSRAEKNDYIYLQTRFQKQELWTIYHIDSQGQWKRVQQP